MAIEVPQNEEISGGGENGERKGVGSVIRWRGSGARLYSGGIHVGGVRGDSYSVMAGGQLQE